MITVRALGEYPTNAKEGSYALQSIWYAHATRTGHSKRLS